MLPCMGSHIQTTSCPALRTARTMGGSVVKTPVLPMRVMRHTRPLLSSALWHRVCSNPRTLSGVLEATTVMREWSRRQPLRHMHYTP